MMRRKPYSDAGLKRLRCSRCGGRAAAQWNVNVCAMPGVGYKPLCTPCDEKLNALVLFFFNVEGRQEAMAKYRQPDHG